MAKIHVMDSHLANLIAAGEVVERPSSVIKELVENSIDALASHIEVRIEKAGRELIMVKDNGLGMDKEDALLCFKRHASSKLMDEYQLFKIKTMGFRGEALPSIASVAKVSLYTSDGKSIGSKVEASEDYINRVDYQLSKGTVIEVKELFYNTPVRLKYLKSDYIETSSCLEVMQRLAISYPSIAFDFYVDSKLSFSTTGRGDLLEVIARIYGNNVAKKMIPIKMESLEFNITGYISKPELTRSTKYYMINILNHRNVYLPKVQKAILDAYKDYLFSNQYPFVILDIEAEYSLIDVNVHPSKKEVRISCEDNLIELVYKNVKKTLLDLNSFHEMNITKKEVENVSLFEENKQSDPLVFRPSVNQNKPVENTFGDIENIEDNNVLLQDKDDSYEDFELVNEINDIKSKIVEKEDIIDKKEDVIENKKMIPEWKVIGQIHKSYIVYEGQDGFYIMDQHAAMERINYEKFQKLYNSKYDYVEPLIPLTIDLSLSEMKKLNEEKKNALKDIGITIEEFGPTTIRIISYPTFLLEKGMEQSYLESIFNDILNDSKVNIKELRRHVIATMACKASLKAHDELSEIEMDSLYKRLFECENPTCCPHGRPTIIHFSKYDIEKLFKRSGI